MKWLKKVHTEFDINYKMCGSSTLQITLHSFSLMLKSLGKIAQFFEGKAQIDAQVKSLGL